MQITAHKPKNTLNYNPLSVKATGIGHKILLILFSIVSIFWITIYFQAKLIAPSYALNLWDSPVALQLVQAHPSQLVAYQPKYEIVTVNPTNYGPRFATDINGVPVSNQPIIVLHETVSSATSTINFFQTPHQNEKNQASYHTLIKLDGTIVYLVPPEYRAFGAGNSVFNGPSGVEAVKTHANFPPSVNNFAYHTALETPPDGRNNARRHSGYTEAQYRSLAWLVAQSKVPDNRITTHRAVDRSGTRIDPRSFDFKKFLNLLRSNRQPTDKQI